MIGTVSSQEVEDYLLVSHGNSVRTVARSDMQYYKEYCLNEDYVDTHKPPT